MRGTTHRRSRLAVILVTGFILPSLLAADELEDDATWSELRADGRSFVFGRVIGRFDGTDYRGKKLRVRHRERDKEYLIPIEKGLGYFEAALPFGSYSVIAIEATYIPPVKPYKPNRFPPVPQRYSLGPLPTGRLPSFPVVTEEPIYLGTIRSRSVQEGVVYEGQELEVVDEYPDALAYLGRQHRTLVESLDDAGVVPKRYFFLKPVRDPSPLEVASEDDPLGQARDYLNDGKFDQAANWLQTFMPADDAERREVRLLTGEAMLGDARYVDAIEELGEVLRETPENTRALRLLARAHAFEGHEEDALNLYEALAKALPEDAEARLHLGYHHALEENEELAEEAFDAAFRVNFDYLLHDLSPYALALQERDIEYTPPKVIDGAVRVPTGMRSRRSSRGGFALLIDHNGQVVAAHLTPNAGMWAPATMLSIIRARFQPAQLNGVPIPCLIILAGDSFDTK